MPEKVVQTRRSTARPRQYKKAGLPAKRQTPAALVTVSRLTSLYDGKTADNGEKGAGLLEKKVLLPERVFVPARAAPGVESLSLPGKAEIGRRLLSRVFRARDGSGSAVHREHRIADQSADLAANPPARENTQAVRQDATPCWGQAAVPPATEGGAGWGSRLQAGKEGPVFWGTKQVGRPEESVFWGAASEYRSPVPAGRVSWEPDREELPVPKLPPIFGMGKMTYSYKGKKTLTGANARWEGIPEIKMSVVKKGKLWYGVLNKFNMKAKYWLNTTTKWNHIKDFPGGAYDPKFNTPEGSKIHEEAELSAVKKLWEGAQTKIKAGIKKGYNTKKDAEDNLKKVFDAEAKAFIAKQQAISNHTNPVGPNAEWSYYKKAYDRYKASLKKAPKKKGP